MRKPHFHTHPQEEFMFLITNAAEAREAREKLQQALAEAETLAEIVEVCHHAQTALQQIRAARLGHALENEAVEVQVWAARKAGKILDRLHLRGNGRKSLLRQEALTLRKLGVSGRHSAAWQRMAALPEVFFIACFREVQQSGKSLSLAAVARMATARLETGKLAADRSDPLGSVIHGLESLARRGKRFGCIYVDAPRVLATKVRGNVSIINRRLALLPAAEVAAAECHCYLERPAGVAGRRPEDPSGVGIFRRRVVGPSSAVVRCRRRVESGQGHVDSRRSRLPRSHARVARRDRQVRHVAGHFRRGGIPLDRGRISPPPYLDVFGFQAFSRQWTVASP